MSEDATTPRPVPPLDVIAQRIADVSPSWANVSVAAGAAPESGDLGLGRDRTIGVESIREGWLLHRDASRLAANASPDLALLIGDWCYAAGLCDIADHGSLDDVAALAALVANVSASCDEPVEQLDERWDATVQAMRHG